MKKDIPLEAIRGIAALVVVVQHVHHGYFPHFEQGWQGSPFFVLMNGSAAVMLFFVLSAYVLTRRYFEVGDNRILLRGAVKRWPRLMGPVLLVVMLSYMLFKLDLYQFEQAGAISGSPWLIKFADAYNVKMPIQFWDALKEGSLLTFFRGDFHYDSPLWTMHAEFIGSFIAFAFALILFEARKASLLLTIALVPIAALLAGRVGGFPPSTLIAFPIGVGLAALVPRGLAIPSRIAYPALLVALYFLGFSGVGIGAYSIFNHGMLISHPGELNIVGAVILITAIETFPPIRAVLSGPLSRFLGELSFPIYLVHVLVICSVGAAMYLWLGAHAATLAVFVFSIIVSLPLIAFNRWWIKRVNAATVLIIREGPFRYKHPQSVG